jgi:hypothetical protein
MKNDPARAQSINESLQRLIANPRVGKIRIMVSADACPSCRAKEGEYLKEDIVELPTRECSHALGCRCFYEPALTEIFP